MTSHPLIAYMLAARRSVRRENSDLLGWTERQWQAWLRAQRSAQEPLFGPRILIVAAISCIEDLPLHVGLMQLLSNRTFQCTVALSLPSDEMIRLVRAQARREGWHMLVHIFSEAKCADMLRRLPESEA